MKPAASSVPLLRVENLTKTFPVRGARRTSTVLDGVSLHLERGESVGLVGESGCGKSTLGRCLVGLHAPTSGRITFAGEELSPRRSLAQRRGIQMVFQDPYSSLNPRMSVGAALREVLEVNKICAGAEQSRARALELLEMVGLDRRAFHAYPAQFSGGQRQRVAIARALALGPTVLVADEPVSALDVSVQATVLNLLSDLRESLGLTMLFISHSMAVIRHISDRVIVMQSGRIVEEGPADELFARPRADYTRQLLSAVPRLYPARDVSLGTVASKDIAPETEGP